MIELVSETRCIGCDLCVKVCPTQVFDSTPEGVPVIARQEDCQTCFMCELYCPTDALFVAADADAATSVDEQQLTERGLLGSYREAVGWGQGRKPGAQRDSTSHVLSLPPTPVRP